jgi:hypothetical protein
MQLPNISSPTPSPTELAESKFVKACQPVSKASKFGDSTWDMSSMVTLPGVGSYQKTWDFSRIPGFPGGFSLALAEYAFARIYTPVLTYEKEVTWLTVHNELVALSEFAIFCSDNFLHTFDKVQAIHLRKFLHKMRFADQDEKKSEDRISYIVRMIYRLWEYRTRISQGIGTLPFGKKHNHLFKISTNATDENMTPVIPEPVFGAITAAALNYVLEHSVTIIPIWDELSVFFNSNLAPRNLDMIVTFIPS